MTILSKECQHTYVNWYRCGKIDETTDKAFGYISNLSESMDLCEKCTDELWDYADKGRQPRS